MALNKLENKIKEQLNSREIQPSAQAWDRLDAMLTVAEEKKTTRSFGWLYIAASILVLVSAGVFFFNQKGSEIQQDSVVTTEVPKDSVQKSHEIQIPKINNDAVAASEHNPTTDNQQPTTNNQSVSINNQKTKINQNQINNDKQNQDNENIVQNVAPKPEENKQATANRTTILSDEQLLASLDNTVKQSNSQKSTVKVDAKKLLSEVDGEVEYTFREKVINKVSKNYKEVKVALANRNNQ